MKALTERPIKAFDITDLARLRPERRATAMFIIVTMPLAAQQMARYDAKRAIERWGVDDAEITVYNGFRYRLPAKLVLDAVNAYRKEHGWTSEAPATTSDLWGIAANIAARVNG